MIFPENDLGCSLDYLRSPKMEIVGLGKKYHIQKARNHGHGGYKANRKVKSSKLKQYNTTELLSTSFP